MPEKNNPPSLEENDLPQVVNLSGVQVENVEAELVRVDQSAIGSISNAEEVDMHQSGSMQVSASRVTMQNSFTGNIHAEEITLQDSTALGIQARQASIDGRAGLLIARDNVVVNPGARTGILVGRNVQTQGTRTLLLMAGKVEGPVEGLMDTRRILLSSVIAGIMAGVILLLGRFLFRRK